MLFSADQSLLVSLCHSLTRGVFWTEQKRRLRMPESWNCKSICRLFAIYRRQNLIFWAKKPVKWVLKTSLPAPSSAAATTPKKWPTPKSKTWRTARNGFLFVSNSVV